MTGQTTRTPPRKRTRSERDPKSEHYQTPGLPRVPPGGAPRSTLRKGSLTAEMVEGFVSNFLVAQFDDPQPIPDFHRKLWELCCTKHPQVAIAAPRGHGKSTAVTHSYTLCEVLFRYADFVVIVSDTYGQAVQFLYDIKRELQDNEDLIALFQIKFVKDTEDEIIVKTMNGENEFKIVARGAGQKVRGTKWMNKRPNLVVIDDLENDEIVMNPERREALRKWFQNALIPMGSSSCRFRMVGTVLHADALLERLLNSEKWSSHRFAAHGQDYSDLLWPSLWPVERLRAKREEMAEQGNADGYAQEYLNMAISAEDTFFNGKDFQEMPREAMNRPLRYYATADFAISEKERADSTVLLVFAIDSDGNLYFMDIRKGRWDSLTIMDELFSLQRRYKPELWAFETEKIDKVLGPFLKMRMRKEGVYLNIEKFTPTKSKIARAQSIRARMRAGACYFAVHDAWYHDFHEELMTVGNSGPRGKHDDQFDAFALAGLLLDHMVDAPTAEEEEEDDWREQQRDGMMDEGRNGTTGY